MKPVFTRTIAAPVEAVFETVADISCYAKAVADIMNVEFLSQTKKGVGTRFRETRLVKGREVATEFEVTEYVDNDRVRIVAADYSTLWDTVFTLNAGQGQTELRAVMEGRARKLLPKLMNWCARGMIEKAVGRGMDFVKTFCE